MQFLWLLCYPTLNLVHIPMGMCTCCQVLTRAYIKMQIASLRSLDRLECSYMRRNCSPEE